jgi:hypothetical protein
MNELDQFIFHIEQNMAQQAMISGDQFVLHALKFAKELRRRRNLSLPVDDVEPKERDHEFKSS